MRRRQSPCRGVPQPASSVPPYDPHNDDGGMHVLLVCLPHFFWGRSRLQSGVRPACVYWPLPLEIEMNAVNRTPHQILSDPYFILKQQ